MIVGNEPAYSGVQEPGRAPLKKSNGPGLAWWISISQGDGDDTWRVGLVHGGRVDGLRRPDGRQALRRRGDRLGRPLGPAASGRVGRSDGERARREGRKAARLQDALLYQQHEQLELLHDELPGGPERRDRRHENRTRERRSRLRLRRPGLVVS